MSSTPTVNSPAPSSSTAVAVDLKLEVIPIPVSDVERAKAFYLGLGWRLDADFTNGADWHLVQMTPPGSSCSVMFGKGFTGAAPGSSQGTFLVVDDLDAARIELSQRGAKLSDVFHFDGDLLRVAGERGHVAGPDPSRRSYFSFASFADPDGNTWLLQEVTSRFPGRGFSSSVATMTELLQETEQRHGQVEAVAPKHHWSQWYAAYVVARQRGKTADEASAEATRHIERRVDAAAV